MWSLCLVCCIYFFFFQAEDGIRDLVRSRGLGDVYKRQGLDMPRHLHVFPWRPLAEMLSRCGFRILSRHCSSGGYGAFVRSLESWSSDGPQKWLNRLGGYLASRPALRLLLLPYVYLAYGLRRGPEITVICEKIDQ